MFCVFGVRVVISMCVLCFALMGHLSSLRAEVCVSAGKKRLAHFYYKVDIKYRQLFLSAKIEAFVVPF